MIGAKAGTLAAAAEVEMRRSPPPAGSRRFVLVVYAEADGGAIVRGAGGPAGRPNLDETLAAAGAAQLRSVS